MEKTILLCVTIIMIISTLFGCSQNANNIVSIIKTDQNPSDVQRDLNQNNQGSSLVEKPKENKSQEVLDYLNKTVPEISEFGEQIRTKSNGIVSVIMRIDREPNNNSYEKFEEYYFIYVGENHSDHTVRWNTFYVHKDLNKILVNDVITGSAISLEKWRELIKQRSYY